MAEVEKTILTAPFTTNSGDYLSVLLSLWLPRYGGWLLLPILISLAIGIFLDVRFVLIAIMLMFIVIPMLSSFLYPYYMLTPEARRAVIRKQVEISEGRQLRLIYLPPEPIAQNIADKDDSQPSGETIENSESENFPLPEPETIEWSQIAAVKSNSRFRIYILKSQHLSFLLIPHDAIINASSF